MISFRYHVVTVVAVLFALAAGIVLGGGPLRGDGSTASAGQARSERRSTAELQAQVAALQSADDFTDAFAGTVAPRLLAGSLRGRVVTLVVLPGAGQPDVTALRSLIGVAGGRVGGTLRAGAPLVDIGGKQLVDELGTQLDAGARGVSVPASAGPYERIGALLGRAAGTTRRGGARVDKVATTMLGALDAAGLMSTDGRLRRRGDLVLLVAGPGSDDPGRRRSTGTIEASLATAVDARTDGVVLAGPVGSAAGGGPVQAVRADRSAARRVSTVDSLGGGPGRVVTVLALAGQGRGTAGQYGAVDAADGPMPATRGTR